MAKWNLEEVGKIPQAKRYPDEDWSLHDDKLIRLGDAFVVIGQVSKSKLP